MEWFVSQVGWLLHTVFVPVLVIGVLVFVHELGHFLFAKWCGVGVVRFAVGFGPALLRFTRKETEYQVGIIPLGGYVRMVGDIPDSLTGPQTTDAAVRSLKADASEGEGGSAEQSETDQSDPDSELSDELRAVISDRNRWFVEKNLLQRSSIVFAGPLFNFIFSILAIFLTSWFYGEQIPDGSARIGEVMKGAPAQKAGIEAGDLVTSINGKQISSWEELASTIHGSTGEPLSLAITRGAQSSTISVTPQAKVLPSIGKEKKQAFVIGIGPTFNHRPVGAGEALSVGWRWTMEMTKQTYIALLGMFKGQMSPKDLAGPLFIFDTAGKQAKKGLDNLLTFMALLSVSLAVLNLLPIPILDGGHLLFFFIEAVMGPISMRKKEFAQQVGMVLLLLLMGFAISNDITRDTSSLEQEIKWDEKQKEPEKSNETQQSGTTQNQEATSPSK